MRRTRWPWRIFVAMWTFVVVDLSAAFGVGCAAALFDSPRLGYLEIPLVLGGLVVGGAAGIWVDESGVPVPPRRISREDRARLRSEESRLEVAAQIRAKELELGIREADGPVVEVERLPERRRW